MGQMLEAIVAQSDELKDGDMREVKVGTTAVLLLRVNGQFHALGANCTHYGAPLVQGALHGERLVCPWHHACFRVSDGALEEPPALDNLPHFGLRVEGGSVLVAVPADAPDRRVPVTAPAQPSDTRLFAIVGGGAAAQTAAETLRQAGFGGRIVILTATAQPPIDRPALSKEYLNGEVGADALPLRAADFFAQHAIEVRTNTTVQRIDISTRTLDLADGTHLQADAILLAPGSTPIKVDVPGAELPEVITLRAMGDAERILAALGASARVIVVGASFIGMEVAASLRKRGVDVTVIAPDRVPYAKILGDDVGTMFLNLHAEQGVQFRLGRKLARVEGTGHVTGVVLDDGEQLPADLVVVGIGVRPATRAIAGLPLQEDGGVRVDSALRLADGVFAAGDVVLFPDAATGATVRIEHWRVAEQHGRHAARAMLGDAAPFAGVPFFWTKQFDMALRYVGHVKQWDEILFWGDPADHTFIAFYCKDGRVAAAAGMKRDTDMAVIEELMRSGHMPTPDALRVGEIDLAALLG